MDPYDSDSSLADDEDFTETGTLLGYASPEIIDDTISHLGGWPAWLDESTPPPGDFADCKVCSRPMNLLLELHGDLPDDFPTDERRLYIFGCARKACTRKPGSVRALRATRKVEVEQQKQQQQKQEKVTQGNEAEKTNKEESAQAPKQDLGASLFGASSLTGKISANANPFSSQANSNGDSNNANPFAAPASTTPAEKTEQTNTNNLSETFADKVRISAPEQPKSSNPSNISLKEPPEKSTTTTTTTTTTPWPPQSAFPPPYPHYYLDAEHEALSRPSTPTIPENVTIDNSNSADGIADLKDTFESELDKAFLRFSTRLEHNPEQILRYEFRGEPLLYSYGDEVGKRLYRHQHNPSGPSGHVTTAVAGGGDDSDSVSAKLPRCEYCGSQRVFELQLVPHAISMLEEGREKLKLDAKDDAGMEWGTILVGVCGSDCAPEDIGVTGWREEWAGVQWEE